MKIKTITCHNVYNLGASLQAYALAKYLTDIGNDVEIIDYKPDYLNNHYSFKIIGNGKYDKPIIRQMYFIAKFPQRLKALLSRRKREFDEFTKKLPLTELRYKSNNELKENIPVADVYFAGSDQIWNTVFENGKDPAFYLDFAPKNSIKAAYAASFATDDIVENYKEKIKKWLLNLDFISLREKSGVNIVKKLGIDNATQVLDPVFLLNANEWQKLEKTVKSKKPYILVYDFDKNKSIKSFVIKKAKEKNLKIYSIQKLGYEDKCFWNVGPATFIHLIRNADFIVSNSFHATAFSLILKTE